MTSKPFHCLLAATLAVAAVPAQTKPAPVPPRSQKGFEAYRRVVEATVGMVRNPAAQKLAAARGLRILDLTWEDTARFKASSVGPNISDMTIQVQLMNPADESFSLHCMPVVRFPNFSDKTADVPLDRFFVLVGNEAPGGRLRRVPLAAVLGDLRKYLSKPSSWKGQRKSLLTARDTHALVSAQACFLPIPRGGHAEFNPVLFNYQSVKGDPAVLTLVATREGTSATVIDNERDAFQAGKTWGQRLFFNAGGKRASFTGARVSDVHESVGKPGKRRVPAAAGQRGLDMVMLVQVPLKRRTKTRALTPMPLGAVEDGITAEPNESAVIGHGRAVGPFTEIDGLDIERDARYPLRITVQFYRATSTGEVSANEMEQIREQIERVYSDADYVGSLVVEGPTGRPTEHKTPATKQIRRR